MYVNKFTWVNSIETDQISIYDRGLAFGDGLFETIRVNRGKAQLIELHLGRLKEGCSKLGISFDTQRFNQDIEKALDKIKGEKEQVWRLKYIVTRGESDSGYAPNPKSSPNHIVQLQPYDLGLGRLLQEQGVKTCSCQWLLSYSPSLAGIKHLNRLDQVMARQEFIDSDCFEGLMRDQGGHYVEGTMTNIFAVTNKDELITPSIENCGVTGVMRSYVMEELSRTIDHEVFEADIIRMDEFSEIFITNAMIGIVPVIAVDKLNFEIGPITRRLQKALQQTHSFL